jgi:hypothetical protein
VLESLADRLGDVRDAYAATLDDDASEQYTSSFDRAARKRFPRVAL